MRILGVNLAEHGSICLINDGQIEHYIEAERITKTKYDFRVDRIIDDSFKPDAIALADCDYLHASDFADKMLYTAKARSKLKRLYPDVPVYDYTKKHHLTHAACGYYRSDFLEAAVVVVDGVGSNGECESIYHVSHNEFTCIQKRITKVDSVGFGKLFEITAVSMGWDHREAGKVMGHAALGEGDTHECQKLWEARLHVLVEDAIRETGCECIVLAGGCMLNCVANYKLLKSLPKAVKLYTEPVAHDGGTSIGAAYLVHYATKIRHT